MVNSSRSWFSGTCGHQWVICDLLRLGTPAFHWTVCHTLEHHTIYMVFNNLRIVTDHLACSRNSRPQSYLCICSICQFPLTIKSVVRSETTDNIRSHCVPYTVYPGSGFNLLDFLFRVRNAEYTLQSVHYGVRATDWALLNITCRLYSSQWTRQTLISGGMSGVVCQAHTILHDNHFIMEDEWGQTSGAAYGSSWCFTTWMWTEVAHCFQPSYSMQPV